MLTERQLVLFDATRDLSRFQTHHRDPSNPQVIVGRQVAEALAEQRGWPKFTLESVDRGVIILFSQQPAGVPVPYSEVAQLTDRSISVERVCEVIAELKLLQDDRVDTLDAWFTDRTAPLSAMVRDEVRVWFEVLRGQRGRSRTRKPDTIRGYIHYALPHLVAWCQTYRSLREVTHDDVKGILTSMTGHDRSHTLSSCRSLFGTLRKHRVIFRNPTARLSAGTGHRTVPLPLPDDELIAIATNATGPERRLLFVLAAIQALRATQMRQLRRDDIDLGNRRLSANGHVRPLDDATLKALSAYLRYRLDRWPLSTNPYLLISQQTAYEDGPISSYWIKKRWQGMAASLERIRKDRQVDELLATGPDPLHFMAVFGSSATTATLYADAVADMLTTTIEDDS